VILATLIWLTKSKEPASSSTASSSSTTEVPPNAAHERASLEEQLKQNPGHAPILLRLAELEKAEGRSKESMDYLKRAVAGDPTGEDARLELAKALYEAGDTAGAERESKALLESHPDSVDGLYNLGAIYANQNRLDLAREYWTRAVAAKPNSDSGQKAQAGLQQIGPVQGH
jgi:tetratricopeptide (TPR) repeat protein